MKPLDTFANTTYLKAKLHNAPCSNNQRNNLVDLSKCYFTPRGMEVSTLKGLENCKARKKTVSFHRQSQSGNK